VTVTNSSASFLYLRVPGWATGAAITPQWEQEEGEGPDTAASGTAVPGLSASSFGTASSSLGARAINGTVQRFRLPSSSASSHSAVVLIEFHPEIRLETDGLPRGSTGKKNVFWAPL